MFLMKKVTTHISKLSLMWMCLSIFLMLTIGAHARVIYVSQTGSPSNTGNSWDSPLDLVTAFNIAQDGDKIWAKKGNYLYLNGAVNCYCTRSFSLKNIEVIGGFEGYETDDLLQKTSYLNGKSWINTGNNFTLSIELSPFTSFYNFGFGNSATQYWANLNFYSTYPYHGTFAFTIFSSFPYTSSYKIFNFPAGSKGILRQSVLLNTSLTLPDTFQVYNNTFIIDVRNFPEHGWSFNTSSQLDPIVINNQQFLDNNKAFYKNNVLVDERTSSFNNLVVSQNGNSYIMLDQGINYSTTSSFRTSGIPFMFFDQRYERYFSFYNYTITAGHLGGQPFSEIDAASRNMTKVLYVSPDGLRTNTGESENSPLDLLGAIMKADSEPNTHTLILLKSGNYDLLFDLNIDKNISFYGYPSVYTSGAVGAFEDKFFTSKPTIRPINKNIKININNKEVVFKNIEFAGNNGYNIEINNGSSGSNVVFQYSSFRNNLNGINIINPDNLLLKNTLFVNSSLSVIGSKDKLVAINNTLDNASWNLNKNNTKLYLNNIENVAPSNFIDTISKKLADTSIYTDSGTEILTYGVLNSLEPSGSSGVDYGIHGGTINASIAKKRIWKVSPNGLSTNTGFSWNSPINLATALSKADAYDEIWLMKGTYNITSDIYLPSATTIIGGFQGDENDSERQKTEFLREKSIISGGAYRIFHENNNIYNIETSNTYFVSKPNSSTNGRFAFNKLKSSSPSSFNVGPSAYVIDHNIIVNSGLSFSLSNLGGKIVLANNTLFNSTYSGSNPFIYNNIQTNNSSHFQNIDTFFLKPTSPFVDNCSNLSLDYDINVRNEDEPFGSLAVDCGAYGGTKDALGKKPVIKDIVCMQDNVSKNTFHVDRPIQCSIDVSTYNVPTNYDIIVDNSYLPYNSKDFSLQFEDVGEKRLRAIAWFTQQNSSNMFEKDITIINPKPSITVNGEQIYNADSNGEATLYNSIVVNSIDNESDIITSWRIIKDNVTVYENTSSSRTIPINNKLQYGKYTLEITSKLPNTELFTTSQSIPLIVNLTKPMLSPNAITCSKLESIINDTNSCSIPQSKIVNLYGTLKTEWYLDGKKIETDNNSDGLTLNFKMPYEPKTFNIEVRLYLDEQPEQEVRQSITLKTKAPIYTFTYSGYDTSYPVKNKTYAVVKGGKPIVRISPQFTGMTRIIKVYKNDELIETIEMPTKSTFIEYQMIPADNVYDTVNYRFDAYTTETDQYVVSDNITLITSPAKFITPKLTILNDKPVGKQEVKLEIRDVNGYLYNSEMGTIKVKFKGQVGTNPFETEYFNYQDKDQIFIIPLNNEGIVSLVAEVVYTNSFFDKKYYSDGLKFNSYSNDPARATLKSMIQTSGYVPYTTSLKLELDTSTAKNFGSVVWQKSRDGNTWENVRRDTTLSNYVETLNESGKYYFRAVTYHAVLDNLTFTTQPLEIDVFATPTSITDLRFRVVRYGQTDVMLTTKNLAGFDSLNELMLLKDYKETINPSASYWRFYDNSTGKLLLQIPFKNTYRTKFDILKDKTVKIVADLKTTLNREIKGEQTVNMEFESVIDGLNLGFDVDGKNNIISFTCGNSCVPQEIKDKLFSGEKITAFNWKVYRDNDSSKTLTLMNAKISSVGFKDFNGGVFTAELVYKTSTGRTLKGIKTININWQEYLNKIKLSPIESTVSATATFKNAPAIIKASLILKDKNRIEDVERVEWYVNEEKVSDNLLLEYEAKEGGFYLVSAKVFNRFTKTAYETPPADVNIENPLEPVSAELITALVDRTKLKVEFDVKNITLNQGETIKTATFTLKNLDNETLKNSTVNGFSSFFGIDDIQDKKIVAIAEGKTTANRVIIASKEISIETPDNITGGNIKIYYSEENKPIVFKCDISNGCLANLPYSLFTTEKISSWDWSVLKDNQTIPFTSSGASATVEKGEKGTYSVSVVIRTSANRTITATKEFPMDFSEIFYDIDNSQVFDPLRYFNPNPLVVIQDITNNKYQITTRGIMYKELGNNYKVQLIIDNITINNPISNPIVFNGFGSKDLVYKLLDNKGSVIKTVTFTYNVKDINDIISSEIEKVVIDIKNVDVNTNTIKITVKDISDNLKKIILDRNVNKTENFEFGINIKPITEGILNEQNIKFRDYAYLTLGSTKTGTFAVQYYIRYNGNIYQTNSKIVDVSNVLLDIELFEYTITKQVDSPYWGSYSFKVIPTAPSNTIRYIYWDTFLVDKDSGEIIVNAGNKTNFGYQFKKPGNYQLVTKVYPDKSKQEEPYYTKTTDIEVVNEQPRIESTDMKMVNSRGEYVFFGKINAVDPDSKTVRVNWSLCNGKIKRDNYASIVANLGKNLTSCSENYFEITDGIGQKLKYNINLEQVPLK